MNAAYHTTTIVLPGNRIEIAAPELRAGDRVEVTIIPLASSTEKRQSALEAIEAYRGPVAFGTVEAIDRHVHEERNSWE